MPLVQQREANQEERWSQRPLGLGCVERTRLAEQTGRIIGSESTRIAALAGRRRTRDDLPCTTWPVCSTSLSQKSLRLLKRARVGKRTKCRNRHREDALRELINPEGLVRCPPGASSLTSEPKKLLMQQVGAR